MPGSAARIPQVGRFGTWSSPVRAAQAAAGALRLSVHFYNTLESLEHVARTIRIASR